MIVKTIHYCWFGGGKLPDLAIKCIDSWRKFLPDYKIKRWDESNFDINAIPYTKEAYENKKYAFVSDYVRFWVLYNEGGIYFDVDVEIIKDLTPIINKGPYLGLEKGMMCNPGLGMAADRNMFFLKECLEYYQHLSFKKEDGSINYDTVVFHITHLLKKKGLKNTSEVQNIAGFFIYPQSYFCPLDYENQILNITNDTYTVHHYNASWISPKHKLYRWIKTKIGDKFARKCSDFYYLIFRRNEAV